jgi:hypothetical protein
MLKHYLAEFLKRGPTNTLWINGYKISSDGKEMEQFVRETLSCQKRKQGIEPHYMSTSNSVTVLFHFQRRIDLTLYA